MTTAFTMKINVLDLSPGNSKTRRYQKALCFADAQCHVCGRPIKNRSNSEVAVIEGSRTYEPGPTTYTFLPISTHGQMGKDYTEWQYSGAAMVLIGSHCAKQLPKDYRVSMKRVESATTQEQA